MSTEPRPSASRWQELRRQGAFQAAIIFASAAWLALQAADVFGLPTSLVRPLGLGLLVVFAGLVSYAWLQTRKRGQGAGRTAGGVPRGSRAVIAAAVIFLLLGGAAWWLRPRLFGAVRAGADVIAVLPFNTSGPSVGLLGEGLVDLLSANLNEVGHVRAVDPRTTLHQWKQVTTNGTIDLDGALDIGRAVGAGSVLLGSVVEAGNTVRLAAELIAVDGRRLAAAAKEGAPDSVFALVDGLSVDLLRDVWRAHVPLPRLRINAITTSSPEALRAYLRGEQQFRRSQWNSAAASLERAVQEDSTFALAHFRLGVTYGWIEALGGASAARPHAEAAMRFADRLPTPARSLMTANVLHLARELAANDTLRAYVARYPEDADGWYLLADDRFHAWRFFDLTADDLYRGFDRVLELDPSFAPALLHPLDLSILLGNGARFQHYLDALQTVEFGTQSALYRAAGMVRWSPREARLARLGEAIREATRNSVIDPGAVVLSLLAGYAAAVLADTVPQYDELRAAYDTARAALPTGSPDQLGMYVYEAVAAAGMGRFQSARALLDTIGSISPDATFAAVLPIYLWAARPPDYGVQDVERVVDMSVGVPPPARYWQAMFALMDGETALARRILDDAGQPADSELAQVAHALGGFVRVAEGDTAAGLHEVEASWRYRETESALTRPRYSSRLASLVNALRTQLALLQVNRPESRDAAKRHLRLLMTFEPAFSVILAPQLAEAYERAGMTAEAARTWARYIAVLGQGDPEAQPHVDVARRSLERLAGEPEPE